MARKCTLWAFNLYVPHVFVDNPWHLLWDLYSLLLLLLSKKLIFSWCVKCVFRHRGHTDAIPGHPSVPHEGLGEAQTCVTGFLIPVGGRYEHTVPILDHTLRQTCYKGLHGCVKVLQNLVSAPTTKEPNFIGVDLGKYQCHCTP